MATGVRDSVTVGLVQVNNSFSGQNYLPYSVGLLQVYAQKFAKTPDRYKFLLPVYKRMPISQIVEKLLSADVVGISTYAWNGRISLEIAKRLKACRPEVLIVFGGPHVPDRAGEFLKAHPYIDLVVHNEGEKTFLHLLEEFPNHGWITLPGTSYIDAAGQYVRNENAIRLRDLDEVPSPFLNRAFDDLMQENPGESWIGLWETNRGCPFQCTFCDWGSATATKLTKFNYPRLQEEVDWFAAKKIEYIFCCDANFGIQPRDEQIAQYVADVKRGTGYPKALSVQSTKNATERAYKTQKILADAGLNKGVALSMQSMDKNTLVSIKRQNISIDTYLELQRRFNREGIETYNDLILGLPGETYESFVEGVDLLIRSGQHNRIQFNNLSILPNAEMGDPAYQAKYGMKTVESEIINIHGERIELDDDVSEVQDLVIETASMPQESWRRTRALCWMIAFLYFDKLFQLPLLIAHKLIGISFSELFVWFMDADAAQYPTIAEIRDFFRKEAQSLQKGGPEYVYSKEWLGIYWPADEYAFIKLTSEKRLDAFYNEAGKLLSELVQVRNGTKENQKIIAEAVDLNRVLVNQPSVDSNTTFEASYDILGFYRSVLNGDAGALMKSRTGIEIDRLSRSARDFSTWCREIVWWGNKKGAYLYPVRPTNGSLNSAMSGKEPEHRDLAGHY